MRAPTFVTVRLEAALVAQLRQASHLVGDAYPPPLSTPRQRALWEGTMNRIAVDAAVRAYVRLKQDERRYLTGEAS